VRVAVGAQVQADFAAAGAVELQVDTAVIECPVLTHGGCAAAGGRLPCGDACPIAGGIGTGSCTRRFNGGDNQILAPVEVGSGCTRRQRARDAG
jgi:hypothetical protein